MIPTARRYLALSLLLAGCVAPGGLPTSGPLPPSTRQAAFPGFDTGRYPGEAALRAWRDASPYRWIGYYLASPCHRDASWMGARDAIERVGFGTAVLYVGQQAFENAAPDTLPPERILCSRSLLTAEQGHADGRDAVAKAAADGFAPGSTIFLDVERMQEVAPAMVIYYQAWHDELLASGRYLPGTYAHTGNAAALFGLAQTSYLRAGRRDTPRFWVSGGPGFSTDQAPDASGFPFATVWQGTLDVRRAYGGVTLQIDENVALRPSPSAAP
jgi:hypothetical protein